MSNDNNLVRRHLISHCTNGETVYLVTYSDLVKEVTQLKPQEIFDAVCEGYTADGDKLLNQREIKLGEYPGRTVELIATDGMKGKASAAWLK